MDAHVSQLITTRIRLSAKLRGGALGVLASAGLVAVSLAPSAATPLASSATGFPVFCSRLIKTNVGPFPLNAIGASSGAEMVCNPPSGSLLSAGPTRSGTSTTSSSSGANSQGNSKNVDAADPHEDVSPAGVQVYGQAEESIAASGPFVVSAWNDATGFFSPCPSPMFKEELTGYGFSSNGGGSFTDEGGLPNDCTSGFRYEGDPTVETYSAGGSTYFYIASLYINFNTGQSDLAMDACQAGATLTCNPPTIIASGVPQCDFLDKEFMTVDQQRGRLYASYTRFGCLSTTFNGQIELAECGLTAADGGSPLSPHCNPGASTTPYLVVQQGDPNCENEGAYPAVSDSKGDVYVAWEFNWATNFLNSSCQSTPTTNDVAYVPFTCLTNTPTSPCPGPANKRVINIVSMDAAFVPGYNRFPPNDFPRIAVSDPYNTVSIVWNDARIKPLGDIFMQSFSQVTLNQVQPAPVLLDSPTKSGLDFLPAVRNPSASGKLDVSWYLRSDPNSTLTDVYLNSNIVPTDQNPAQTNYRVTNTTSDWSAVSSDIIPNFGDYTDNYVVATPSPPYTDKTLYINWADGRLGVPNPFVANVSVS